MQTILAADSELDPAERRALAAAVAGVPSAEIAATGDEKFLTQKEVAELLGISRTTAWRFQKAGYLQAKEILPGVFRYSRTEVLAAAHKGQAGAPAVPYLMSALT